MKNSKTRKKLLVITVLITIIAFVMAVIFLYSRNYHIVFKTSFTFILCIILSNLISWYVEKFRQQGKGEDNYEKKVA